MAFKTPDSEQSLSPCTSSYSSTNDELILMTKKNQCPVCNDISFNRHFGVACCNACAAFFRRTVAHQRRYICVRGKQCHVSFGNPRHMCRHCRFRRCVASGMEISAIFVSCNDEYRSFSLDSPLRTILLSQRATYVNRYSSNLKAYGNDHTLVKIGVENPNFQQTSVAISSEFSVLFEYLLSSGFANDTGLSMLDIQKLAKENFYTWICFQSIINTLRNAGHKRKIGFFVDESHIEISDSSIEKYVRTMPNLLDYDTAIKATLNFFSTALHTAKQIHLIRMSEVEYAVMFHVLILQSASKLFPDRSSKFCESINDLFLHLRRFYEKNFDDIPIKMGNLILILEQIGRTAQVFTECANIFYLNGYNKFLSND